MVLWKPDWKRGPEFRAPNSGENRWLSRRLIPFRRVLFFVARLGPRLLLRLTSTAPRGGRDFSVFPSQRRLLPFTFRQDLVFAQCHSIDSKESAAGFLRRDILTRVSPQQSLCFHTPGKKNAFSGIYPLPYSKLHRNE